MASKPLSIHFTFNIPLHLRLLDPFFALTPSPSPSRTSSYNTLSEVMQAMEDFNIPSAERVALLERLQEAMGGAPPYFWAACQICDLKALENLIEHSRISPAMVRNVATVTVQMVLHWTQSSKGSSRTSSQITTPKKRNPSDLGSSPASSPPAKKQKTTDSPGGNVASPLFRNQAAKTSAKQRDNFRCVLTGDGNLEVAHIYPFHSLKNKEEDIFGSRHIFWDHLKNFWPEEKVAAWEAELFPGGIDEIGLERVCNLITLSRSAHSSWNRGAFALKPISVDNDNNTLKVQFFWQKKQNDTQATMSLLTTPLSTEDLDRNKGAFDSDSVSVLFDIRTDKLIKSGDIFELKTDNAIERPLPSFKLLEMQWFLQRVVGMAGAAIPYDEDWGDEDSDDAAVQYEAGWGDEVSDDEISNPGLEEAKDDSFVLSDAVEDSPPIPRRGSLLPVKHYKHHTEAATGDGVGDRDRGREIM